ncbi:MAG: hypothetical protein PF551_06505 [Candidatus Marinimicrobia bacterium]|jgi:hypothetical protein|nr:hypothetical protein [Candidatus Neomarinimicrobiota bacterium]
MYISRYNLVKHQKYKKFQKEFGYIPASDKTDIHKIKSRMLQGIYRGEKVEGIYCNYVNDSSCSVNFMRNEKLKEDAKQELKEIKRRNRLTDETRLCNNLLSSQPLAFNIFLPLKWDNYQIATEVFKELLPQLNIEKITDIKLEYVPGDEDNKRLIETDKSCFDTFVEYITSTGQKSCVGIEVKYTEPFSTTNFNNALLNKKQRYLDAIDKYKNQFYSKYTEKYLSIKFNQLFRNHLIIEEVKSKTKYSDCIQVVLFSEGDTKCIVAVDEFTKLIKLETSFRKITIEELVKSILDKINEPEIKDLYEQIFDRYCNYSKIEKYINE